MKIGRMLSLLVIGVGLASCVGVHLDVKRESAVTAGPYHRTLVIYLSGNQEGKGIVEGAFREALRGTQQDPGRSLDVTDFAMGTPLKAAQLGYDSVLVVARHPMVHWQEAHPATLAEALVPPLQTNPLAVSVVNSEGPGARRYVNGCARLYDAVTTRLVWTAHGTLSTDKDEWTARPARVAAKAIVHRLTQDGLLHRIP